MSVLQSRLADLIAAQGPLSVAQFMALALLDPEEGYYASRDPFGTSGDFITAPEISQMFGELLGVWAAQAWQEQGAPARARLVELGPGRGTLMADALRAIRQVAPGFLQAIEVVLIEASDKLARIQRRTLADFTEVPIRWRPSFDDSLTDRPLFVLANEFFDALPIRQFIAHDGHWHERMVGLMGGGHLGFARAPMTAKGLFVPAERGRPEDGAVFEICPAGLALAEHLGAVIEARGGAALVVDYGYGAGVTFGDTLQAVHQHAYAPVLERIGEADLSAHVDFLALAGAARRGGASVYGPIGQGVFLDRIGLQQRAARLALINPDVAASIGDEAERLRAPKAMGELFKVLALTPSIAPKPAGF